MSFEKKALDKITDKVMSHKKIPPALDLPQGNLFIEHALDGVIIPQNPRDGYINATAMCKKANRNFSTYYRAKSTVDFLSELSADVQICTSQLIQIVKGGSDVKSQGTWVHPQVAIHLAQWLSPQFAVQVSKWVFEWMRGNVSGHMPFHVKRYLKNKPKIPYTHFSMLNEIYLNLLAPLEDAGFLAPNKMIPDISTGRMFSAFLRQKGINPDSFPYYWHEFDDDRPSVKARLYPSELHHEFIKYFNEEWLPKHARAYFTKRAPTAINLISRIMKLPEPPKRISKKK